MPEWIIEDICEFYLFLCRHKPTFFEHHSRDEFLTLSMVILRNPGFVKNPYLKSKFVEILFFFTLALYQTREGEFMGKLDGVFRTHPLCAKYLVPTIIRFYVGKVRACVCVCLYCVSMYCFLFMAVRISHPSPPPSDHPYPYL